MQGCSVLVVDDDMEYLDLTKAMLSDSLEVLVSSCPENGLRIARARRPDLILLDVCIPEVDGVDLCAEIRADELTKHIPILMVSGASDAESRVRAFMAGADDYIAKPFTREELVARVGSKIRRIQEQRGVRGRWLRCGNLRLSVEAREVLIGDTPVRLTPIEFALLRVFLESKGAVLSRRDILGKAWNGSVITERTIDSHLKSLRRKLAGFDHCIRTRHGVGFLLQAAGAASS